MNRPLQRLVPPLDLVDTHFVCHDLSCEGWRNWHVVVRGRYVGRQVIIDDVAITRTTQDRETLEKPMRVIPYTNPPRYEPV